MNVELQKQNKQLKVVSSELDEELKKVQIGLAKAQTNEIKNKWIYGTTGAVVGGALVELVKWLITRM